MSKNENTNKMIALGCIIILAVVLLIIIILPLTNLAVETNEIAIISINGELKYNSNESGILSPEDIELGISEANNNPNVKAIVLEINSNGGSLVASEEIAEMIKSSKKPVIAWIGEKGTGPAYLIASSADYIVANPSSSVGKLGFGFINSTKYSNEKISGEYDSKLLNKTYKVNKKIEKTNLTIVDAQEMLNQDFTYYIELISENRNLTPNYVSKLANFDIYNGNEALKIKLIDKLGYKEDAIKIATSKANLTSYDLVKYPRDSNMGLTDYLNEKINIELKKISLAS